MSTFSQPIDRPARAAGTATGDAPSKPDSAIASILLDVAIPLCIYYLLHDAFGLSLVTSMAGSSVLPAIRTIVVGVREHALETLAALMLTMNLASIAVSLASGDARLLFAREAAVSSVIALWALGTVALIGHRCSSPGSRPSSPAAIAAARRSGSACAATTPSSAPCCAATRWPGASPARRQLCPGVPGADGAGRDLPWLSTAVTGGSIAFAVIASGAVAGARVVRLYEQASR